MSILKPYHANGKLLLTAEYLVLHGAKAIALPLKSGQQLTVSQNPEANSILWNAYYQDQLWFSCKLSPDEFSVIETSSPGKAQILSKLFQNILKLNPGLSVATGTIFETVLDANPEWGFGSSSTLVSLISQWGGIDPFLLNELVFGGSGFDVACAKANGPIFYTRNEPVQKINLDYPFEDQLFLLYSGQKMKTNPEVSTFLKKSKPDERLVREISGLSDEFARCRNQEEFNRLIRLHENIIGILIGKTPVKQVYFPDFDGVLKSLGAWGGDFYLVSTAMPFQTVKKYFENKGLTTLLRWNDWILKRKQS
ncbi:MAG: GYDIA family GHMP kinase [Prolixibacteraceae bacterium]